MPAAVALRLSGRHGAAPMLILAPLALMGLVGVTLTLRQPGILGKEISFSPPRRFPGSSRSPIIDELIERVDRARRDGRRA